MNRMYYIDTYQYRGIAGILTRIIFIIYAYYLMMTRWKTKILVTFAIPAI